jgi:L-iditol 2-dehydrogenase
MEEAAIFCYKVTGKINIDFMITYRFKLEQTRQAFDMVAEYRDGVIKALIEL